MSGVIQLSELTELGVAPFPGVSGPLTKSLEFPVKWFSMA